MVDGNTKIWTSEAVLIDIQILISLEIIFV